MRSSLINSPAHSMPAKTVMPMLNGRPDYQLADALTKVPQQAQAKAKTTATDFEAMFLNSMFSQMMTKTDGEGPFGGSQATGVWRSFLTQEYAKSFAQAGGIGLAKHVYSSLLAQQEAKAK